MSNWLHDRKFCPLPLPRKFRIFAYTKVPPCAMYFDNHKEHSSAKINPSLLWEYDLAGFDFEQMRDVVVQRVVERGWPDDWYAALDMYGIAGMKAAIKALPYLNDKDMYFVSSIFGIPLSEMKCYKRKRLHPAHWDS